MADGEWGGTQFRVQAAGKTLGPSNANPRLNFSMGGFQQARTATLGSNTGWRGRASVGNRFYMEGSIEMLDAPGEWHFDPETRSLYVFPPAELSGGGGSMDDTRLVLTQTDTLFDFAGSASDAGKRVQPVFQNSTKVEKSVGWVVSLSLRWLWRVYPCTTWGG